MGFVEWRNRCEFVPNVRRARIRAAEDDPRDSANRAAKAAVDTMPLPLKRAYLIIVLSFAWLIGCAIVGITAGSLLGSEAALVAAILIGVTGCGIGLTIGITEVALAKGYSLWLGFVLGISGFLGLVIVELLPNRWEGPR